MDASWNVFVINVDYVMHNVRPQPLGILPVELQNGTAWVAMAMPADPETVGWQPPRRLVTDSGEKQVTSFAA